MLPGSGFARLIVALVMSATLAGCVATSSSQDPDDGAALVTGAGAPDSLPVAIDLISALVQLEGYAPYGTTVQTNAASGGFGQDLIDTLALAGYGLQIVSADQGRNYLSYRTAVVETGGRQRIEFEMALGFMTLSRRMRIEDGRYVPDSPIILRNAPVGPIFLNGSVYVARADRPLLYPSGVLFIDADGIPVSRTQFRYAYFPTGAAKSASGESDAEPARFLRLATGRLYDRGPSVPSADSASLALRPAEDFVPLKAVTIRFPGVSDDLLGQGNRNALETLVSFIDPAQDRLTVLSCAPDRTRTDSSVARSTRIKSELLTLGVAGAQVLELGCPQSTKRAVARRGILVMLERLRAPG